MSSNVESAGGMSETFAIGNMQRRSNGPPRSFGRTPGTAIEAYSEDTVETSAKAAMPPADGLTPPWRTNERSA